MCFFQLRVPVVASCTSLSLLWTPLYDSVNMSSFADHDEYTIILIIILLVSFSPIRVVPRLQKLFKILHSFFSSNSFSPGSVVERFSLYTASVDVGLLVMTSCGIVGRCKPEDRSRHLYRREGTFSGVL
jgi:hypothetical protein